jgi:hypothetical protein
MNWYYVEGGQQAGPVEDAQFRQLVTEGRIRGETLVWREGMPEWLPYQRVFEQSQGPAGVAVTQARAPGADKAACVECGGVFNQNEMISYGTAKICAECKPVFLQKLAEGVPVSYARGRRPKPVNPDVLINEVLARDYQVNLGSCLSRGWALVKANLGLVIGATFLVMLCNQASGFIPFLGILLSLIVQGPLLGGLNVFYLKLIRGEQAGIGDAFSGFSKLFWPLCGTFLLMILIIYACFIPLAAAFFIQPSGEPIMVLLILTGILGVVGAVWLGISFIFALPLAADLELGPWSALRTSFRVVARHWLSVFVLALVAGIISMLGLLACIIGVFVTITIFYATTLYAYEDIFSLRD